MAPRGAPPLLLLLSLCLCSRLAASPAAGPLPPSGRPRGAAPSLLRAAPRRGRPLVLADAGGERFAPREEVQGGAPAWDFGRAAEAAAAEATAAEATGSAPWSAPADAGGGVAAGSSTARAAPAGARARGGGAGGAAGAGSSAARAVPSGEVVGGAGAGGAAGAGAGDFAELRSAAERLGAEATRAVRGLAERSAPALRGWAEGSGPALRGWVERAPAAVQGLLEKAPATVQGLLEQPGSTVQGLLEQSGSTLQGLAARPSKALHELSGRYGPALKGLAERGGDALAVGGCVLGVVALSQLRGSGVDVFLGGAAGLFTFGVLGICPCAPCRKKQHWRLGSVDLSGFRPLAQQPIIGFCLGGAIGAPQFGLGLATAWLVHDPEKITD